MKARPFVRLPEGRTMSKLRVWKLLLAGFLLLAALSFDCPDALAQELTSSPRTRPAPAGESAEGESVTQFPSPSDAGKSTASESSSASRQFDFSTARFAGPGWGSDVLSREPDRYAGVGGSGQGQQTAQTYVPLTPGEKMRRAFKRAFLSPEGHLRSAVSAVITEATEEDLPHKDTGDRVADGLSRFAIKSATRATRTVLGSGVYAVLFRQDPRYERSRSKNYARRTLHAVSRVFVTRGDDGGLEPNYSRWAGSLSARALSNIWERSTPGRDRVGVDATFRRFGRSFITDAWQTVVFNEFMPDIIRIFRR